MKPERGERKKEKKRAEQSKRPFRAISPMTMADIGDG